MARRKSDIKIRSVVPAKEGYVRYGHINADGSVSIKREKRSTYENRWKKKGKK